MADRFFICPDGSNQQEGYSSHWQLCSANSEGAWVELSRNQLIDFLEVDIPTETPLTDLFLVPHFDNSDYLTLSSAIALYFATCWCFNIIGRQINPR